MLEHLDLGGLPSEVTRRADSVVIDRQDGMQAVARDASGGLIEVRYEWAPHETACESCSPEIAGFLRRIFERTRLARVLLPNSMRDRNSSNPLPNQALQTDEAREVQRGTPAHRDPPSFLVVLTISAGLHR